MSIQANVITSRPPLSSRQWLLLLGCVLMCIGLVLVSSASMDMASLNYESPFFFLKRHGVYLAAGVVCAVLVYQIPLAVWQRSSGALLIVAYLLLALVLLPGIGKTVNGSTRWIHLGPINVQVSEIVKVFSIMFVAGYLVRRVDEVRSTFWGFMKPVMVLSVMVVLLLKQPDFGAVVVIMTAVFAMLFLAGARLSQFLAVTFGSAGIGYLLVASSDYRWKRVMGYIDPWADQYSTGYQLVQSLIAFGRGEWTGVGLGNSIQKLFYLPEAHTDFVFAILAEEFGFVGNLVVIALYLALVWIAFGIGRRAEAVGNLFNAYMVYGFATLIGLQAMVNVGVASGLLPTKGLTLPFISYGGSSLIIMSIVLALIMRADLENQMAVAGDAAKATRSPGKTKASSKSKGPSKTKAGRKAVAASRKEPVL
ncbi:putative lipid II flippase FtsW [Ketobacter sp.]|uniref:putative lipid II flippase FtsW n=1 Tax=Ketobacter sp. TaxID=2083498 RepID=UPI000F280E78|nr:putative lipid II flippase FtsW [Ketobacter sp.]RLU00425.1 MAG: putative lipid II flippase FtsW [Ketobacter sp.]